MLKFIHFFSKKLFGQGSYFTPCKKCWQEEGWDVGCRIADLERHRAKSLRIADLRWHGAWSIHETSETRGRARRGYSAGSRKIEDRVLTWDEGWGLGYEEAVNSPSSSRLLSQSSS